MKNLRLLQMNAIHLTGNLKHLSSDLRWLCWHKCPLKFLPHDFHVENLVVLDLQQSKIKQVWKGYKVLNKLRVINLQNSKDLIESPDFSGAPHLEILTFEGCTMLVKIHESIGFLEGLIELNLGGCISLSNLPSSIVNLKCLKTLNLSDCRKLFELLQEVRNMMAHTEVHGNDTITKQGLSSSSLSTDHRIELFGCKRKFLESLLSCLSFWTSPKSSIGISLVLESISRFRYLEELNLEFCGLSEDIFPTDLEGLSSLLILDLSGNYFRNIPPCICFLPKLFMLHLEECSALQSISKVPTSLRMMGVADTLMLKGYPNSLDKKYSPIFTECESLDQVNLLRLISLPLIYVLIYEDSLQEVSCWNSDFPIIFLQNIEVSNWFNPLAIGSLISFRVPAPSKVRINEIVVCACYRPRPYSLNCTLSDDLGVRISIYNRTKGDNEYFWTEVPLHFASAPCHIYRIPVDFDMSDSEETVGYVVRSHYCFSLDSQRIYYGLVSRGRKAEMWFESGDEMEISVEFCGGFEIDRCGIHLQAGPLPPWFTITEDDDVTL